MSCVDVSHVGNVQLKPKWRHTLSKVQYTENDTVTSSLLVVSSPHSQRRHFEFILCVQYSAPLPGIVGGATVFLSYAHCSYHCNKIKVIAVNTHHRSYRRSTACAQSKIWNYYIAYITDIQGKPKGTMKSTCKICCKPTQSKEETRPIW